MVYATGRIPPGLEPGLCFTLDRASWCLSALVQCRQSPGLLYRVSPVGLQKEAAASTPCSATDREAEKPLKLSVPEPLTRTIKILAKDGFFMLRV